MIRRIIIAGIFLCLLIAIPLALMGIERVEVGEPFLAFMRICSQDLEKIKFEIPDIPKIPEMIDVSGWEVVLNVLIKFVNFFSSFINVICDILNVVVQLLEFIVIVVKNLVLFKDTLARSPVPII